MSGEEVQVDPGDLHRKATQIEALSWSSATAQPELLPADGLLIAQVAAANLNVNAQGLWARQEYGRQEGLRLAQTLHNVADAYAQVDQMAGQDIDSAMDGPAAPNGPGATVFPKPVDIPAPAAPAAMPIPKGQLASDEGFLDVTGAENLLGAGDDAASLRAAAAIWRTNGAALQTSAETFEVNSTLWEGEAADAAYAKFNAYRDWLVSLAEAWENLAAEADQIADAHDSARDAHAPIAEEYQQLEEQTMGKPLTPDIMANLERMAELQASSEEVRTAYSVGAVARQYEPGEPPDAVVSGIPVTEEDHRRARSNPGSGAHRSGTGGGGQPSDPAGAAESLPREAPVSPMSAAEQAGQAVPEGASQGGGSPGGGQGGSQGGSPGGGSPGGAPSGMPGPGRGDPKLPNDPSLRPAASGGGGGGAGAGGGGGGMPSSPLQPAVGAETVAPTPVASPGAPGAAASGASGGGATGGGMGGMAPMMGGARGGESGDKKRNPQLAEDEEIYTEERPHTEPVIGYRPRRRGGPDDSKKESQ